MRALLATALLLVACDAYDEDLGPAPFYCGADEPACPMGYECMDDPVNGTKVCVASGDTVGEFACDNDNLEPNDTLATAVMTNLDSVKTYSIDGRAICQTGDKDVYALMIAASGEHVEATITFKGGGALLAVGVLNTGGVTIGPATAVAGESTMSRAEARNLASGLYYVQVLAPPSGGTVSVNNYKLSIAITGP